MKKRSRFTNKQNRPIAGRLLNPRSEEHLSLKNQPYLSQKGQSSSETSLHLYTQLNQVVDVLKYEFHSHTEGHTPKRLIQKNSSGQKKKKIEMAEQVAGIIEKRAMLEKEKAAKLNKMTELVKMKGEIEAQLSDPLDEEEEQLREKLLTINKEIQNVDSSIREADAGLKYWEEQLEAAETQFTTEPPTAKKDQSSKDTAEAGGNPTSMVKIKSNMKAEKEKLGGRIKGIDTQENNDKVVKMKSTIQDIQKLMETGYISKADLNIAKLEQKIQNSGSSSVADAKKDEEGLQTNYSGGSKKGVRAAPVSMDQREDGEGKKRPPGPPPPTPDPKAVREESEFPLYDSAVLVELREADERAAKAAKAIESVREQLAVYAKKDEMTDEDINMMEEKQKELMAKMEEFEEITKKVQHLVGLVDVASSQLGPPQRPMLPTIEGVRTAAPGTKTEPEDTLPKVIVCGTGDVDQVPKIIVCEPTKAKDGQQPVYHQIQATPSHGREGNNFLQSERGRNQYQPQGTMGPSYPLQARGVFPGCPIESSMIGLGPGVIGMNGPGFMMGNQGMGMLWPTSSGGMMDMNPGVIPPGTMLPSGVVMPPCLPNKPRKSKQKDESCCYGERELEELLEASLNMTEKLAEENTQLEGNRYELQEAVLDKDKQHDSLMVQLESMKQELKTVRNENHYLKNMVAAKKMYADGDQGAHGSLQGENCCSGLVGNKPTGMCKKELKTVPICKLQAYKEMNLPMPRLDNKPKCPGAKFAVSMGWNENQGCRNELNKSINCTDKKGSSNIGFDRANANMGSGDPGTGLPPCNKEEMDEIVMKMEQEVKCLQNELELVQAERKGLALQKKLLNCMAENSAGGATQVQQKFCQPDGQPEGASKQPLCNKPLVILRKPQPENLSTVELQLNSLREQYRKLQEDYNCKVEEVSMVRVEYEAAKRDALALLEKCREAEARVDDLLDRLRAIEMEKTKMAGSKDHMLELEQQLTLAKQRYREGQEELEEIKTTMQDQMLQLEEYRNKYLTAQQTVEEQRRQIDIMELENNRISEQVNLEIQRVKNQFQEKLQELTPLPDMLKATQLKLQECDQLRQLAERNVEQLLNQTDEMRDQNKKMETELDELRKHTAANTAENNNLASSLTTGEKKIEEIKSENTKLRATVARLEEVALNNDRRLDEKTHEVLQLQTQLETLREESARQVSRTKDRCESIRRTLQSQISQLECQLAQSRAAARTAQKDRDEIRQRMQAQITSLNDNFDQAQLRIRSLQSHVNYLKSSYTNIFCPEQNTPCGPKPIDGLSTC